MLKALHITQLQTPVFKWQQLQCLRYRSKSKFHIVSPSHAAPHSVGSQSSVPCLDSSTTKKYISCCTACVGTPKLQKKDLCKLQVLYISIHNITRETEQDFKSKSSSSTNLHYVWVAQAQSIHWQSPRNGLMHRVNTSAFLARHAWSVALSLCMGLNFPAVVYGNFRS